MHMPATRQTSRKPHETRDGDVYPVDFKRLHAALDDYRAQLTEILAVKDVEKVRRMIAQIDALKHEAYCESTMIFPF
jgi:hypothetical protein